MENSFENKPLELPEPWYWANDDLTQQLRREIPDKHILASKSLKSVGRRYDNDDALSELENDEFKYAVVHLTWALKRVRDTSLPITRLYKDWNDLYINRILVDHKFCEEL